VEGYFCLVVSRFKFEEEAFLAFGYTYKSGIPAEIFVLNPRQKLTDACME